MVFITSTGFTNPKVYDLLESNSKKRIERACILTTALIPLKENHPLSAKTYNFLSSKGIKRIDYIDIETQDAEQLLSYDLVFILGGNSYHLFYHIKKSGADEILIEMVNEKLNIVGASAGAMLLSSGNEYAEEFGTILGIKEDSPSDTSGLNITNHILFPHYDMFCDKIPNLENQLISIESRDNVEITRLKNMDFIYVGNDGKITTVIE